MTKKRVDKKGDTWALAHRKLPGKHYMHDIDGLFGMAVFGQDGEERLFAEYVPDRYENNGNVIRDFALIAMFDRKATKEAAQKDHLGRAFYTWLCRTTGENQPTKPRFFYVIGNREPPWRMVEIDITTGRKINKTVKLTDTEDWNPIWEALGLARLQRELKRWVER